MKKENKNKKYKKKRKFKIKFKGILITFLFLYLFGYMAYEFINQPISNIYISGNYYLTDWEVIKYAGLEDYPQAITNTSKIIEKRLENNNLIKRANVKKKAFAKVYIEIIENRPILYSQYENKTVLLDDTKIDNKFDVPILVSSLEKEIYDDLLTKMSNIELDVLNKMSEVSYAPDFVDDERFVITMTDGNYVYLTLKKFYLINDYNSIVKEFNNKKGILYLNSGGYFKIMEN